MASDEDGIEMPIDERTFRDVASLTFVTRFGPFDILFEPSGAPTFDEMRSHAQVLERFGLEIPVASAEDLIDMKRAAGREKDLMHLEALLDFVEDTKDRPAT